MTCSTPTAAVEQVKAQATVAATKAPAVATSAPAKPTATPLPKVGDTIKGGNWEYQVTKLDQQKTITWSQYGNKADAKGIWQIVHIKLQNVGNQTHPINAWDFEVKDDAGITYKADAMVSMQYSDFSKLSKPMDNYPPGVPAEIGVAFDINPAAKGLKLNLVQAKTLVDLGQ